MFIELYALLHKSTGKMDDLEKGLRLARDFLAIREGEGEGYFPFYSADGLLAWGANRFVPSLRKRVGEFQLLKQNSNLMMGLLTLQNFCKDEEKAALCIEAILDGWVQTFFDQVTETFYTNFQAESGRRGADLTAFHAVEIFLRAEVELGASRFLGVARSIADGFLRHQDPRTGLIPFIKPKAIQSMKRLNLAPGASWLDSGIDFTVALLRLYERTDDIRYLNSADALLEGLLVCHRADHGFFSVVDTSSGTPWDSKYSTKMTALVLKAIVARENVGRLNEFDTLPFWITQDR
jgi:hypothetical protein